MEWKHVFAEEDIEHEANNMVQESAHKVFEEMTDREPKYEHYKIFLYALYYKVSYGCTLFLKLFCFYFVQNVVLHQKINHKYVATS